MTTSRLSVETLRRTGKERSTQVGPSYGVLALVPISAWRAIKAVRNAPTHETVSSLDQESAFACGTSRSNFYFYPQPSAMDPTETRFRLDCTEELRMHSLLELRKRKREGLSDGSAASIPVNTSRDLPPRVGRISVLSPRNPGADAQLVGAPEMSGNQPAIPHFNGRFARNREIRVKNGAVNPTCLESRLAPVPCHRTASHASPRGINGLPFL